ncbi:MAG: chromosome partitioning protein [Flavobacteriales bacterium]|jgi:chromosome partitioning protein
MEQVFVANPKGGCGKTTIAAQLAGYYASRGDSVVLVDHDPQRSSSDWLSMRPSSCHKIILERVRGKSNVDIDNADVKIHDLPATWTLACMEGYVQSGDYILVPILASPTDIRAAFRFIMSLHREGVMEWPVKIGFIANRTRRNTRYYQVLAEFVDRIELPLISTLRDTQNYVQVMDKGLSLFDIPQGRVRKDLDEWQPVIDWLKT